MWTTVSSLSVSRDAVGVCLLGDRLYAVGGHDGQSYLNTVESYDAQNNEWTEVNKHKRISLSIPDLSKVSQCSFRFGEHSWLRNAVTWCPQEHRLSAVSRLLFSFSFLSAWNKIDFFSLLKAVWVDVLDVNLSVCLQEVPLNIGRAGACVVVVKLPWACFELIFFHGNFGNKWDNNGADKQSRRSRTRLSRLVGFLLFPL